MLIFGAGHQCIILQKQRCSGQVRRQDRPGGGKIIKKDEAEFPREFQRTERVGVPNGPVRS